MSAMGVVNATEGLLNALALGVAAGGRPQHGYAGDSPRTVHAVRQLISQLQKERAANATLSEENAVLRHALEEVTVQLMRMRDQQA